jgi:hypothetical protein
MTQGTFHRSPEVTVMTSSGEQTFYDLEAKHILKHRRKVLAKQAIKTEQEAIN